MRITFTPTQVKESLLRDLRAIGYSLAIIKDVKTYTNGSIELDCEFYPKPSEED